MITVQVMQINPPSHVAIREASGFSQAALSRATKGKVSQGRISTIESSEGPVTVRPETAKALAEAMSVPVAALTVPNAEVAA